MALLVKPSKTQPKLALVGCRVLGCYTVPRCGTPTAVCLMASAKTMYSCCVERCLGLCTVLCLRATLRAKLLLLGVALRSEAKPCRTAPWR